MNDAVLLTGLVILAALAFDFVNGFHDAANSIATIVATRVLSPGKAVLWAAFFNFASLFLFSTGVAKTVGSGMVRLDMVTPTVILTGLLGAVVWELITWWRRIPTSSSHALLGGYAGAAMTYGALTKGVHAFYDPIIVAGWAQTILFIVLAPVIGMMLGHFLMRATMAIQKKFPTKKSEKFFRVMQLFSSAFLSLMHGSNDAQKTAGIIAGTLVTSGRLTHFHLPMWVLVCSYSTMSLGTLAGGWRIVDTMGKRLTRLRPAGGFCAETAAATAILLATSFNLPVSTTHATTGAILGTGSARSLHSVRWNVAGRIMWVWVLTIPCAGAVGAGLMLLAIMSGQ